VLGAPIIVGVLIAIALLIPVETHGAERIDPGLGQPFESTALHAPWTEDLSDAEKLAGLSLIWSEAKYNFANFDLVPDLDWDAHYLAAIPRVLATETTADYYLELQRFIGALHDGHSGVNPPQEVWAGTARPPLYTRLIEDEVVIYLVDSHMLLERGLAAGQIVRAIDGVPIREFAMTHVAPFVAASTPHDLDIRTYNFGLLRGPREKPVMITVERADGSQLDVEVPRTGYTDEDDAHPFAGTVSMRWVADGVALIDIRSFNSDEYLSAFRELLPELMTADAWIFDVRLNGGGNSSVGWAMLEHISDEDFEVGAWRTRIYRPTYRAWQRDDAWAWHDNGSETWENEALPVFAGPVAVLTSARTYSAAEDFAIAFRQLDRGPIIGQTTGGSTGQPLRQPLPGGGNFRICTKRDSASDGTEWIGIGIEPDIEVLPTIQGIRTGVDPVVQRAIREVNSALD
jgi:C-terminal processing protease CtpA/Prc